MIYVAKTAWTRVSGKRADEWAPCRTNLQFAGAMIAWGVLTSLHVTVTNYIRIIVLRFFIGFAEALIQGAVFYLSFWYRYSELATRGSVMYSTAALAGSFNGLIAYAIVTNLDGRNGLSAWKWIFLIEGLLPIGCAFLVGAFMPHTPETVKWGFSEQEKKMILSRSAAAHNTGESKVYPKLIFRCLIEPQFWFLTLIDAGSHFCSSSVSNFLPDIIRGLGYESIQAQLMSVICYVCFYTPTSPPPNTHCGYLLPSISEWSPMWSE